jgi:hypothetical protein
MGEFGPQYFSPVARTLFNCLRDKPRFSRLTWGQTRLFELVGYIPCYNKVRYMQRVESYIVPRY